MASSNRYRTLGPNRRVNGRTRLATLLGGLSLLFLACIPATPTLPDLVQPEGTTAVLGGITDQRPYFGSLLTSGGQNAGNFLLATCGCGDWRILATRDTGDQVQMPVRFYTREAYVPTGSISFFGSDNGNTVLGIVDQDQGSADGNLQVWSDRNTFTASRGNAHAQAIQACVMCHVGDNPIWPQPAGHTPYISGQTDCYSCHKINIE